MALPSPLHANPPTSGLSRFSPTVIPSPQVARHGFTGAPVHLHLSAERLTFASKTQFLYQLGAHGNQGHTFGVTVLSASQQASSALEAIEGMEGADASIDSAETALVQLDSSKQPLPEVESKVPPAESFNQPPSSAGIESKGASGDGTSLTDAVTSSPETSLANQSSDLESMKSSAEGSVNDLVDSSQEATDAAKDFVLSDQYDTAKDAYDALSSGPKPSVEPESAVDTASQASKNFLDTFVEAKSALENSVRSVQDSIQNSVDDAGNAVKSSYENVSGALTNFLQTTFGSFEKPITEPESGASKPPFFTQENLLDGLTSPFRTGTSANNALKGIVQTVEDATGTVLLAAGNLIAEGYTSTKEVLPESVRFYVDSTEKTVSDFTGPLQSVIQQVYTIITDAQRAAGLDLQSPAIPVVLVTGGTIILGILYWKSRDAGYSGDLTPTSAYDLLRKDGNIILVDIRPEDAKESEGVPDLRRQVRLKAAIVEPMKVNGSLRKLLKNVNDADAMITATIIKNLKNVKLNTKIIVMDRDGSQSKSIAKSLKKLGIKMPYLMDGGFRAWAADGLRVKQFGPETPLTLVKEETQAILEEIKPTPIGIAAVTLGVFAGTYALIEWEKTLQLLGLICIAQLAYLRLNSYESVDDMKEDLRGLLRPFAAATQGITSIAEQSEPSKLQLPTSPSTSAVQDRVLQAAAKHGPIVSDSDQQQEEQEQVSEEASPEDVDATSIQDQSPVHSN